MAAVNRDGAGASIYYGAAVMVTKLARRFLTGLVTLETSLYTLFQIMTLKLVYGCASRL
jgi:hypothetical protein